VAAVTDPSLSEYGAEVAGCVRCALAQTRTQVVFGAGSPTAELMFVGEAPGFHEDKQGVPFVGAAGKLLSKLLEGIGMSREDVYVANVLKCLRYTAQVQLGDGTWERIGRLVRSRYSGTVMSVDGDGRLVQRRVIGWHTTPLAGRRIYRMSFVGAKPNSNGRAAVDLTGDHPVLTERGYVPAQELVPGDRVATGQGLDDVTRDVVIGSLLGDASLNPRSSYLEMGHSAKQAEYAKWKAELLESLGAKTISLSVAAVANGPRDYQVVHVRTRAHRALRLLRPDFYDGRKIVPWWLDDELNERILAIWFMDDGYTRHRPPNRRPLSEIATNGFDEHDLQVLLRGLARLGLPAKALRGRLYFDAGTTRLLSERIAPFVPSSMRYKLDPEVERTIPFDEARFAKTAPRVIYDDVQITDVTELPRTDQTVFCIDVESTHNFVTTGGVVHNCRPPGNRNPLPEEIEACEGHLFRQIELIQPALVATLGNFSTKLLSGKQAGITQVHGRVQDVVLGGRPVRLYPIFHPAAALYTPRMLQVLEEDFSRLPELLGHATVERAPVAAAPAEPATPVTGPADQLGLF
jgi:uracil-DNA glycosylase family 4